MQPSRNLFLIGMPGAGKTTLGRALSRRLGRSFHDSDHEIEVRTGVRVPVIFEIEGEAGFRRREAEAIERLSSMSNIVLATGGGAVLDPRNREHLKQRGFVIYLHAAPRELWRRTKYDRSRPLLQGTDPRAKLEALYIDRDPLYRQIADLVVETGRQSSGALLTELLPQLDKACGLST